MLALAHHIERLADDGSIESYAEAAEALGVTRARMSQITSLCLLAPNTQEQILAGGLAISERDLRPVSECAEWEAQHIKLCRTPSNDLA